MQRVYLASDHAALEMKATLVEHLQTLGCDPVDLGPHEAASVDYPDYAAKLAQALSADAEAKGVLLCGTGIGISIAANRFAHIRAALCKDTTDAKFTRLHNDANVVALGARTTGIETAKDIVSTFFSTDFEGGRHRRRVDKLTNLK